MTGKPTTPSIAAVRREPFHTLLTLSLTALFALLASGSPGRGCAQTRQTPSGAKTRFEKTPLVPTAVPGTVALLPKQPERQGQSSDSPPRPSPGKAALRSFLLPGWGQISTGSKRSFRVFFGVEVSLWLAYAGFQTAAHWKEDAYRLFAREHAGIDPAGKDKQFYINIENYDSIDDYNQAKLRNRDLHDYYRNRERYYWKWDSPANRATYERMRVSADRYLNRAELTVGGILANHLISALHAMWVARRAQSSSTTHSGFNWDWSFGVAPYTNLSLHLQF